MKDEESAPWSGEGSSPLATLTAHQASPAGSSAVSASSTVLGRVLMASLPCEPRRTFNFQELAGEPVIILNIATRCSEIDANYDDLRDVRGLKIFSRGGARCHRCDWTKRLRLKRALVRVLFFTRAGANVSGRKRIRAVARFGLPLQPIPSPDTR